MLNWLRDTLEGFKGYLFAWSVGLWGFFTLDNLFKVVMIVYTLALLFFLLRDKWWNNRCPKQPKE